jgi:hypothetical protein
MKVLLRSTETGLFYAGPDSWNKDPLSAAEFDTPDDALNRVSESKLARVEVVMHFEGSAFDVPLTIVGPPC